ncbi:zinc finger protein 235-like [Plodia interpunctella]|uniref:zinc finger protein 235-like n=1 Tax=Plodia interpunctella TaxID=58824 RepID=UPI00236769B4|nr:zinc finger protein 235-like [Plodia interpunctella]XP_053622312.1 zinc finger protein 235-like [Plodia interpunctella]XP_053622313.1 zinc finger protein 235-like [Plodia interpunctella]XP_053622314.1 zinc finger protein 235-like [Plodia interpunctella]XP_053622315.1 zinc finger protein 235-like [Plodia interpunctella]
MSVRMVNVVPNVKIKKEIEIPDDDDEVSCKVCGKGYAREVALRNHVRMEHVEIYLRGDDSAWLQVLDARPKVNKESFNQKAIRLNTEKLLSSMGPQNLMSLASEDVSYIIIKSEDVPLVKKKKEPERNPVIREKRDREPKVITGPFECLQPSNLVAAGTCHQIFFSCCEYSAHFRDEHTRRRKGHRCQVCEKPLVGEHTAPFSCDVCGAGFSSNRSLAEHTSTAHVKLKPFQCSVCHKRFTQQGGVQQHMRMHTGDRPFPCTFCPKAFTQKSGLDQHLRIHTKVKPYRCVICAKSFCQSIHLKQHMRTHTNVSPFQCVICQKRFKQSSHLNYHLKNHNPANMTDEQKEKYAELVGMMRSDVQIEVDTGVHEEMETEQVLAEQSIQIVSGDEYVLSDSGHETWSVQLVDS